MKKRFVPAHELQQDSYTLAADVLDSGFVPDVLLVVLRGGAFVGLCVHEYFLMHGHKTRFCPVMVQRYVGIGKAGQTEVLGLESLKKAIKPKSKILIVDDVLDSGRTLDTLVKSLKKIFNNSLSCKIAVVHYKYQQNKSSIIPDFFVHKIAGNPWIVYPHELYGLTDKELKKKRVLLNQKE